MKDLNSPFKMEHKQGMEYEHIEWNKFSDPFTKAEKNSRLPLPPKLAIPCCHTLVWVGGSREGERGGVVEIRPDISSSHGFHAWL